MSLMRPLFFLLLVCSSLASCTKDENNTPLELLNASGSYEAINNYYDLELNLHFTQYTFSCDVINNSGAIIDKLLINYEFDDGRTGALVFRDNKFEVINKRLLFKLPIRFNAAGNVSVFFRVLSDNNTQSNMVYTTQKKPEHAF